MQMLKNYLIGFGVVMMALCIDLRSAAAATACENLATLSLLNTTVTLAQPVAAGAFTPPAPAGRAGGGGAAGPAAGGRGRGQQFTDLPAFCRVQATLKPSSDSEIKMELWMPVGSAGGAGGWNGKLRGTGNGGLGGGAGVNAGALAG